MHHVEWISFTSRESNKRYTNKEDIKLSKPDNRRRNPKVEERIVSSASILVLFGEERVGRVESWEEDDEEGRRVLAGVGQVRKGLLGVAVTAQTLGKAKPKKDGSVYQPSSTWIENSGKRLLYRLLTYFDFLAHLNWFNLTLHW